jgi:hypothetical protein
MLGNYHQVADGSQRAGCRYAKIRLRVNIFDWKCNGEMTSGDFIPKASRNLLMMPARAGTPAKLQTKTMLRPALQTQGEAPSVID